MVSSSPTATGSLSRIILGVGGTVVMCSFADRVRPAGAGPRGMGRMCILFDRNGVEIGMCGASKRSSSSAAYSQTFSGLAEGLSNYHVTPGGKRASQIHSCPGS